MKLLLFLILHAHFLSQISYAQTYLTKSIKTFGAKGDGRTNDHIAFEKAATFFNKRGGNGKLIIPAGTYIIGKQEYTGDKPNAYAFTGKDVLHFDSVKNFTVEGTSGSILRYRDSLRFGTFDPKTKFKYTHENNFYNSAYAAVIGHCIFFGNSKNVSVKNLIIDGNNINMIKGGGYGDIGTQLPHYGIFIYNSQKISVTDINAHHFALDGMSISNILSKQKDEISITNSSFEYNSRQGFSWIGGNDLHVKNCKFNHTGKSKFSSPPGAGVDIEAEIGPVRNGVFEHCEFADNTGCGLTAVSNDSACSFIDCTFWGVTNWSTWITTPAFTFTSCRFYGSTVWGYNSPDDKNATKYFNCIFEDKPYEGKEPYGNFLIESNEMKRVFFKDCRFIANKKKLCWIIQSSPDPQDKYQFINCYFTIKNANYEPGDFVAVTSGMRVKNCTFQFTHPDAKKKHYFFHDYKANTNVTEGGSRILYPADK
jgi:hypothetical protein